MRAHSMFLIFQYMSGVSVTPSALPRSVTSGSADGTLVGHYTAAL